MLIDSIVAVTGLPRQFKDFAFGTRVIEVHPRIQGDANRRTAGWGSYVHTFRHATRHTVAAAKNEWEPTQPQVLHLAEGDSVQKRLVAGNVVNDVLAGVGADRAGTLSERMEPLSAGCRPHQ